MQGDSVPCQFLEVSTLIKGDFFFLSLQYFSCASCTRQAICKMEGENYITSYDFFVYSLTPNTAFSVVLSIITLNVLYLNRIHLCLFSLITVLDVKLPK